MPLNIVIGPMYSGKTEYCINTIFKNNQLNKKQLIINHKLDERYAKNSISTHDKRSYPSLSISNLSYLFENNQINLSEYEYILIDESQFFNDLYEIITRIMEEYPTVNITCAGLDGDYKQELFNQGQLLKLIPKADKVIKLYSKCYICNKDASFTKRLNQNQNQQILVGSSGLYVACCREHL